MLSNIIKKTLKKKEEFRLEIIHLKKFNKVDSLPK